MFVVVVVGGFVVVFIGFGLVLLLFGYVVVGWCVGGSSVGECVWCCCVVVVCCVGLCG